MGKKYYKMWLSLQGKEQPGRFVKYLPFLFHVKWVCNQGWTYPLDKGRRLPWAPKSQGPPKMLFIYEMRIKRGHANVYGVHYHDNRLRVRVERASCVSHERKVSLSQRVHTSLSLSRFLSLCVCIVQWAAERSCAFS